jgi:hypothetical protein
MSVKQNYGLAQNAVVNSSKRISGIHVQNLRKKNSCRANPKEQSSFTITSSMNIKKTLNGQQCSQAICTLETTRFEDSLKIVSKANPD